MPSETLPLDLDLCAREPIHVPGHIQPFGVLLAMRTGDTRISQVSNNTELIFGQPSTQILGMKLDQMVGSVSAGEIARVFEKGEWREANPIRVTVQNNGHEHLVNAILHRHDGLDFVELEALEPTPPQPHLARQWIHGVLLRIQNCMQVQDLWDTVAAEVQRITGFDRIMIYKFDRDQHGSVIAERKQPDQPAFLGLHYPASDIPEQARRLYTLNWIRYIPDAHYKPVALIPIVDEEHSGLTDLTYSVLRSVSPVHCEYLQNMGVAASMSISIMRGSRLWGLIACHHSVPRQLRYDLRAACEVIGQALSIRIAALEENEDGVYRTTTSARQSQFLTELPSYSDIPTALVSRAPNLLDFIPSSGGAVCVRDRVYTVGEVPKHEEILAILRNTLLRVASPVFVTDQLQDRYRAAESIRKTASGVLCFTVSSAHDFHVMWFRTERVHVMRWAGEPTKPVVVTEGTKRLTPRRSFEVWKQEVRGKSEPWTQAEIDAAAELRATLLSLLLSEPHSLPSK